MTDIEIPDNETVACDLDQIAPVLARKGQYGAAEIAGDAARRLRADAEKIKRLEALVAELDDRQVRVRDADATGWLRREIENHNTSRESAYVSCRLSDLRRVLAHIDRIESELNDALCEARAEIERLTRTIAYKDDGLFEMVVKATANAARIATVTAECEELRADVVWAAKQRIEIFWGDPETVVVRVEGKEFTCGSMAPADILRAVREARNGVS